MDKFHSQGLGWYCPIGPKYLARVTPCPAVCPTPSWWSRCSRCPRRPPSPGQWSPCHHDCRPPLHPTWTPAWRPLCRKHWSQCQEWDLQMIKITKRPESSKVTNGGVGIVVGASHKSASGVIQYGHHLHLVTPTLVRACFSIATTSSPTTPGQLKLCSEQGEKLNS